MKVSEYSARGHLDDEVALHESNSGSEGAQAKLFIKKLLLFGLPFWLCFLLIALVDPYNFLPGPSFVSDEVKLRTSARLNSCFWKMNQFHQKPSPNILLGDSRMAAISTDKVRQASGEEYFNFAYGGGSLKEVIDTFWFAAREVKLQKIYIGLNLNIYNDSYSSERTQLFIAVKQNPLRYFLDLTIVKASYLAAYSELFNIDPELGVPQVDKETFWQHQLGQTTDFYYSHYAYPSKSRQELIKIAQYCKDNNIQLSFVIFPTHVELQNRVHDYHLEKENEKFKLDLAQMAVTFDFDYDNEVTKNKENFSDPYHFVESIGDILIKEIWSGKPHSAMKYP